MRPLAVFDIDGTLVDSRASIHQATCDAAAAIGLPPPSFDRVRQIVGLSLETALATLEPDLDRRTLDRLVCEFRQSFGRMYAQGHEEPLYAGAAGLLTRLKTEGWTLALATGQNRRGVARNLARQGWSDLFLSSHCADDGPGKPDPAMLQAAMKACDTAPETTVMIGDTAHDMAMARSAGVQAQGVGWGFHTVDEQITAGAHHVAKDFDDLHMALDRFTRSRRKT